MLQHGQGSSHRVLCRIGFELSCIIQAGICIGRSVLEKRFESFVARFALHALFFGLPSVRLKSILKYAQKLINNPNFYF
jgi:hypothetical protein